MGWNFRVLMWFPVALGCGVFVTTEHWWKLRLFSRLPLTHCWGGGCWSTLFCSAKSGYLDLPFGFCWQKWEFGLQFSSMLFGRIDLLLSESFCISRLSLSWSFGEREQAFLWATASCFLFFFCLWLLMFVGVPFLQYPVWNIWSKKKPQGTHHLCSSDPEVPSQPAFFLSTLRSCVCFIYNFQGF